MTERELKQLFFLKKEIEKIKEEIEVLGYQTLSIPIGDGLPKGKGSTSDKVGKLATEIVYLKDKLELKLKESYIERNRIEQFLDSIEDREIRLIFRLRHVNCMNWRAIGRELGYDHSVVFRKHKNFLQQKQQGNEI